MKKFESIQSFRGTKVESTALKDILGGKEWVTSETAKCVTYDNECKDGIRIECKCDTL